MSHPLPYHAQCTRFPGHPRSPKVTHAVRATATVTVRTVTVRGGVDVERGAERSGAMCTSAGAVWTWSGAERSDVHERRRGEPGCKRKSYGAPSRSLAARCVLLASRLGVRGQRPRHHAQYGHDVRGLGAAQRRRHLVSDPSACGRCCQFKSIQIHF